MASNLNVDQINPVGASPINFTGPSIPTFGGVQVLSAFPNTPAGAIQAAAKITAGTGVPTGGSSGWFYFRSDGGTGSSVYMNRAGTWVAIL